MNTIERDAQGFIVPSARQTAAYKAKSQALFSAEFGLWQEALRNGGVPYGRGDIGIDMEATEAAKAHLGNCQFSDILSEVPTFTEVGVYREAAMRKVVMGRLRCSCGEVDTDWEMTSYDPDMSLADLLVAFGGRS